MPSRDRERNGRDYSSDRGDRRGGGGGGGGGGRDRRGGGGGGGFRGRRDDSFDRDRGRRNNFGGGGGGRDRDRSGRRGGGGFREDSFRRGGRGPPRGGDRGGERRDRSRDVTENMEIESDKVKYVIGRGGTKIRDIQYQCRVSVQIDKSPNESGYNNVQISGAPHSIKRAKDAINDVVRRVIDFEDKEHERDSRSRDRDRRRKYSDSE